MGPIAACHIEHLFRQLLGVSSEDSIYMGPKFVRVKTGEMHPFGNFVLGLDPADVDNLDEALAPFIPAPAPSAVIYTGEPVSEQVNERLKSLGFESIGQMPAMVVDLEALRPTALPAGHTFEEIGLDRMDKWSEALAEGYELPIGVAKLFTISKDFSGTIRAYAVLREGRMEATSLLFLNEGVAGIYCVSTLPEARGKGLGAHVTAEPLRLAAAEGYRVGLLQASEMGHPIYLKLGFKEVSNLPMYLRMP